MFTTVFVLAVLLMTVIRVWLNFRELRCLAFHSGEVPVAFVGRVSLEVHQRAADYTTAIIRASTLQAIVTPLWLIGVTVLGGLQVLNDAIMRLPGPDYAHAVALVASVILIPVLLDVPFGLYRSFHIDQRYGFNRTTWRLWITDALRVASLGFVLLVPLLSLAIFLIEQADGLWWLCIWGVWAAFVFAANFVFPVYIAPLFNTFVPLADGDLRRRVETLLARCGFSSGGTFVVDGSRRSTHGNAYFTGAGRTKRIVLYDTLLTQLSADELEAVLAHELGHFRRNHVGKLLGLTLTVALLGLMIVGWMTAQPWFYPGLGITHLPDLARAPVTLALLLVVSPPLLFFVEPLINWFSRRFEYEADAFAASVAGAGSLADALVALYDSNGLSLTTDSLRSAFFDSHPPIVRRIERIEQLPLRQAAHEAV